MLVSRVTLGDPYLATGRMIGTRRPPERLRGGRYDSVVANVGTPNGQVFGQRHREFVVFDRTQAYPELAIYFYS